MENWLPVPGNDAYQVSDLGNVRRVTAAQHTRPGRLLAQQPDRWGYMRVRMMPEGKRHRRVHLLVWEAFKGPVPPGLEINHEDGIKANNRLSNLHPVTSSRNKVHALQAGLNGKAKITGEMAAHIRTLKAGGMTGAAIARKLGLGERLVQKVCSGKTYR